MIHLGTEAPLFTFDATYITMKIHALAIRHGIWLHLCISCSLKEDILNSQWPINKVKLIYLTEILPLFSPEIHSSFLTPLSQRQPCAWNSVTSLQVTRVSETKFFFVRDACLLTNHLVCCIFAPPLTEGVDLFVYRNYNVYSITNIYYSTKHYF